ncbi:MAG: superoxide dismutase [Fe] [Candidatus Puniceispirillum sp.]|nr:superoxide dismutase [Fe] [Candidatus Pelagibacter sp.]MBA4283159.1 superoxide dismutase [Fe] [Candidatus Puniceispirillum sp.]
MFTLPNLPYAQNALEPHISEKTISFHYGKHHQGYLNMLNKLIEGTDYATMTLDDVMKNSHGRVEDTAIFNNSAQVWNHTFYWNSMKPNGGGNPQGKLHDAIIRDFGETQKLIDGLKNAATTQFGSGWAWLCSTTTGQLTIQKTGNAQNPITDGLIPLLTIDVWEHAYYLDYQNLRVSYLDTFFQHLINWEWAQQNYELIVK